MNIYPKTEKEKTLETWLIKALTGYPNRGVSLDVRSHHPHKKIFEIVCGLTMKSETASFFKKASRVELISQERLKNFTKVDIALKAGNRVHVIELKYDAQQDLGQYLTYLNSYQKDGYKTTIGAIVNRKYNAPAEKKLAYAFMDGVVKRATWRKLLDALQGELDAHGLTQELERLAAEYPFYSQPDTPPRKLRQRDLNLMTTEPYIVKLFFDDLAETIAPSISYVVQTGNAPISLLCGLDSWACGFQDSYACRVGIAWDLNSQARKKFLRTAGLTPPAEQFFSFVIIIFHRSRCFPSALSQYRYRQALTQLQDAGYALVRNKKKAIPSGVKGDWHHGAEAIPSDSTAESSLLYINAQDLGRWHFPFSKAKKLGWEMTIKQICKRYRKISGELSDVVSRL